jgi:hypothetical protein
MKMQRCFLVCRATQESDDKISMNPFQIQKVLFSDFPEDRLRPISFLKLLLASLGLLALLLLLPGCATPVQTAGLTVGITAAGAHSPTTEIEQIYYLGVFDPQEQVPPAVYRVRVHGQASMISVANFASGWVPASVADSLTTQMQFTDTGAIKVSKDDNQDAPVSLKTGRRLILFGPEGFREAPRDYRLVIIMSSDPSKYFQTVSQVLEATAKSKSSATNDAVLKQILLALTSVDSQKDDLQRMLDELPAQPIAN